MPSRRRLRVATAGRQSDQHDHGQAARLIGRDLASGAGTTPKFCRRGLAARREHMRGHRWLTSFIPSCIGITSEYTAVRRRMGRISPMDRRCAILLGAGGRHQVRRRCAEGLSYTLGQVNLPPTGVIFSQPFELLFTSSSDNHRIVGNSWRRWRRWPRWRQTREDHRDRDDLGVIILGQRLPNAKP